MLTRVSSSGRVRTGRSTKSARPVGAATVVWVLTGGFLSTLGDCMVLVAAPWVVVTHTGSLAAGGVVAAAEATSTVLSGVLGGPVVDRFGSRRPAICSELAAAALIALIPALYWAVGFSFWALLVLVTLKSFFGAPGATANQRLLPDLASATGVDLARLNSWYWLLQRIGFLVGGPLAGLLLVGIEPPLVFCATAGVFLSAALATGIALSGSLAGHLREGTANDADQASTWGAGGYIRELVDGLRVIFTDPLLRTLAVAAVMLNLFDSPLVPLVLPALVLDDDATAGRLGLLVLLYGLGTAIGTALSGVIGSRFPLRATVIASLCVSAASYLALARTDHPEIAVTVLGLAAGPLLPILVTLVQRRAPEAALGRVLGTMFAAMMATIPLGRLLAGLYLEHHTVTEVTLAAGVAFAGAAVSLAWLPALRSTRRGSRQPGDHPDPTTIAEAAPAPIPASSE